MGELNSLDRKLDVAVAVLFLLICVGVVLVFAGIMLLAVLNWF